MDQVHESGPWTRSMDQVHGPQGGPWTGSTGVVHGPGSMFCIRPMNGSPRQESCSYLCDFKSQSRASLTVISSGGKRLLPEG